MLTALSLLCFLAPSALEAAWSPGFKVRFNESATGIGSTSFISLPRDKNAASSAGWVQVARPDGPTEYASLVMWCPNDDYAVCVLYDDTGYVAGMQIGVDQETVEDQVFDMKVDGFTDWAVTVNGKPKRYWAICQFYVSPEYLSKDPATRVASRDPSKFLQDTDIFVQGFHGKVHKIPADPKDYENSIFLKHNCLDGMGTHYYYNITAGFECADENMFPWFLVVQDGQLVSLGMLTYGRRKVPPAQMDWLEDYNEKVVDVVFKDKIQCLWDIAKSKGAIVLHTYFIDNPYDIKC